VLDHRLERREDALDLSLRDAERAGQSTSD
jgi:hypothetical protein